jgi:hypothetical protein
MAEYEPTSRRPIAQIFRRTAEMATRLCVRLGIHPDAISHLSILAALAAAVCFWNSGKCPWLLVVPSNPPIWDDRKRGGRIAKEIKASGHARGD